MDNQAKLLQSSKC